MLPPGVLAMYFGSAGIQVVANMVTGRGASPQEANSFLSKVFQSTDQHLDAFQQLTTFFEGIINQQGDETPGMNWPTFSIFCNNMAMELSDPATYPDRYGCTTTAAPKT